MRLARLNATNTTFVQLFGRDGIAMRREPKAQRWDLVCYRDLAPTVPYQICSRHVIEGGHVKPPLPKGKARQLSALLNSVLGRK